MARIGETASSRRHRRLLILAVSFAAIAVVLLYALLFMARHWCWACG